MDKPRAKRVPKPGQEKFMTHWTVAEDNQLLEDVKILSIDQISKDNCLSTGAIYSRLAVIAIKLIEQGKSIDEAVEITKASRTDIDRRIGRAKAKKKINDAAKIAAPLIAVKTKGDSDLAELKG